MLAFHNVEFSYSNQPVFNNLSFTLEDGEFLYLIGKSGSGKSTLLQMIYMNKIPQSGYVQFNGNSSDTIKTKEIPILRRKIGVIYQDFKLLRDRNIYENLAFVLRVTNTPMRLVKRKVMHALTEVGLSHKQNNMPNELSGGEQQRVAIARAIINEPTLILADEPTGNLDPETSDEIMKILKKINLRGTSIICATHNYDLVKQNDSKIIKLADGKAVKVIVKQRDS